MKRSEINAIILQSEAFFREKGFLLPPLAALTRTSGLPSDNPADKSALDEILRFG